MCGVLCHAGKCITIAQGKAFDQCGQQNRCRGLCARDPHTDHILTGCRAAIANAGDLVTVDGHFTVDGLEAEVTPVIAQHASFKDQITLFCRERDHLRRSNRTAKKKKCGDTRRTQDTHQG